MSAPSTEAPARIDPLRKDGSYREWVLRRVLSWARKPGGSWALFFIAVIQSGFFPVPLLLVFLTLSLGAVERTFRFALICAAGSITGGALAYLMGYGAWDVVKEIFIPHLFSEHFLAKAEAIYQRNVFVALLVVSLTPLSYQVCSLAAGVLHVNFWAFLAASCVARPLRFLLFATLVHFFGERAKTFLEEHLRWVGWGLLLLLIIGGTLAIVYRTLQ